MVNSPDVDKNYGAVNNEIDFTTTTFEMFHEGQ